MQYVFRSLDRGDTWERISPDLTTNDPATRGDIRYQTLFTISESPLKYGLIYAGTDDGRLWVTKDGGKAWQEITAGLAPGKWMSRVVASAAKLGTVYLTQNGKRDDDFTPYVWKSTDYGKTWTSLAKGIPVGPVNVIREDPVDENILYVGTDMGVYVTTDGGKTWDGPRREPADRLRPRPDHPPAGQHHRHRHPRPRHVGPGRRHGQRQVGPETVQFRGLRSATGREQRPRDRGLGARRARSFSMASEPVLFVKSRKARRISLTVRASRGVRVAVPWRVSFDEARRVSLDKPSGSGAPSPASSAPAAAAARRSLPLRGSTGGSPGPSSPGGWTPWPASTATAPGGCASDARGRSGAAPRRSGRIQLNAFLAVVPPDLADYVILHELVHTRVRGHGRAFWAELDAASRTPGAGRPACGNIRWPSSNGGRRSAVPPCRRFCYNPRLVHRPRDRHRSPRAGPPAGQSPGGLMMSHLSLGPSGSSRPRSSLLALCRGSRPAGGPAARKANYDLASRWTSAKVGKLVFDTAVTPRWLETGDRFWYTLRDEPGPQVLSSSIRSSRRRSPSSTTPRWRRC